MRRSFDALALAVRERLALDPESGALFVFASKRRTQVKLLVWMRGGFTILHRRLERGRFMFPARVTAETPRVEIDAHELAMLLEGLDAAPTRSVARWDPPLRSIDTTSALV